MQLNTLKAFYDYVASKGIDRNAIYEEKEDGFVVISFPEMGEKDCIYNIAIVFYENDNDAEIYIRKPIKNFDELELLRKLNALNCEYSDVTFLIDDNMLTFIIGWKSGKHIEKTGCRYAAGSEGIC